VLLLSRVRALMAEAHAEHVAYETRLYQLMQQYPSVAQHVEKRRGMLSAYACFTSTLRRCMHDTSHQHPFAYVYDASGISTRQVYGEGASEVV
jgi:hypothetical protein